MQAQSLVYVPSYAGAGVRASERAQASAVDAALRAVEKMLVSQKTIRDGIRAGHIRVDTMIADALRREAHEGKP